MLSAVALVDDQFHKADREESVYILRKTEYKTGDMLDRYRGQIGAVWVPVT